MRAKITLTDKDLLLRRDESLSEVDDPDAVWTASATILLVEKDVGPDSFKFNRMEMTAE